MGRLIDADAFIEYVNRRFDLCSDELRMMIEEQPTAYDVEKVVAELETKDELIKVLSTKLLQTEFGICYMCKNPMKNITLDGTNNGCDGQCNTLEKYTVDDFLKKIISELEVMKVGGAK